MFEETVRSADEPALSLRDQCRIRDEWLGERLSTVAPAVMEEAGVDCWVLIAREYNEDPVVKTMLPATWEGARRRTILVFTDYGRNRIAVSRYSVDGFFTAGWNPDVDGEQWQRLADYLEEQNPRHIAINRSPVFALADGMTAAETEAFLEYLSPRLVARVVSTPLLAIGWLETRSPSEREAYPEVCRRAHRILRRALSPEVITPGSTPPADVEWWLREESARAGYATWFHPHVSVQRASAEPTGPIRHGDLVHIDFGIEYLGLHTDQQQHGYVLKPDEVAAPHGLRSGIAMANRLQDLVMAEFRTGATGNDILRLARDKAEQVGLRPSIYSHPIGLHGHGAGPTIGLWDQQSGVSGSGDYPVRPDTAYSIELSVTVTVPEWGESDIAIMLEEDAYFDGDTIAFLDGRQTDLWLI